MTNRVEREIESEVIKSLYDLLGTSLVYAQAFCVMVLIVLLYNHTDPYLLSGWAIFLALLILGNRFLYVQFHKKPKCSIEELRSWELYVAFMAFMFGIGWGVLPHIIDISKPVNGYAIVVVLSLLSINGSLALGLSVKVNAAFSFSLILIGFLAFVFTDYAYFYALCLFGALILNWGVRKKNLDNFKSSIALRFQNQELVSELRQQKEEAEKSSLAKTKFLAAASHDLRQPLQSVSLLSAALDFHIKGEKERSILGKLQNSVDSLGELLNSLLDISKLDADVIQPEIRPTLLTELLQQSVEKFEPVASEKGLIFGCQTASNVWAATDPQLLARIISNLLENAIRYTESGSVSVVLKQETNQAVILLKDTGIGIRDEDKQNIFTEFYQVDNPERDRQKGLGLGLSIVKRLSDLLGIQLEYDSQPGVGTTFKLSCPLAERPSGAVISVPEKKLDLTGKLHVLVVDDEASVRDSMRVLFEAWSCFVLTASDESEALTLISSLDGSIDALFVDYRLREGKTGVQLANKLVASLDYDLPVMVIRGDTAPEQLREIEASGFHLSHKPIQPKILKSFLEECAAKREVDLAL